MHFFFIVLIVCMVFFLFKLYHLANDDFVLAKKNVTLDQTFNCALIVSAFALLSARIFYVLFHPSPLLLSPLGFLLFPYFPGLSLVGGLLGGILALFVYSKRKKFPLGRVFDFFTMAFIFILPIGLIGYFLFSKDITRGGLVTLVLYVIIFFSATIFLYPKARDLEMKEGTTSILFIIFFSLAALLAKAIDSPGVSSFATHPENFILLIMLIGSVVLIVKQEFVGRIGSVKS